MVLRANAPSARPSWLSGRLGQHSFGSGVYCRFDDNPSTLVLGLTT